MKTHMIIVVAAVLASAPLSSPFATETGAKDSPRQSAGAAKDAVLNIGNDGKEAGRGAAAAAKETGKAVGQGAKNIAKDVSTGFRRDFIEGGALKGPRPAQPKPGLEPVPAQ